VADAAWRGTSSCVDLGLAVSVAATFAHRSGAQALVSLGVAPRRQFDPCPTPDAAIQQFIPKLYRARLKRLCFSALLFKRRKNKSDKVGSRRPVLLGAADRLIGLTLRLAPSF
jgi:hypothetical protein